MKLFAVLIAMAVASTAADARATTLLVSNTNDSGAGSLRQAIADNSAMGGGNTIVFSNVVTGAITLTSGELLITSNATILGPGPGNLAVSGNAASRVFHISNYVTAVISGLTITNGIPATANYPTCGIWNDHSTLALSNCAVSGNTGGGILNDGSSGEATLSIFSSTLNGDSDNNYGGAIINEGYAGNAILTIIASTFCSNTVVGSSTVGGAIFNDGNSGGTTVSISNCTFSGNSAGEGGAIFNAGVSGNLPTVLTVTASTFDGNSTVAGGLTGGAIFNIGSAATLILGDTILAGASGGTIYNEDGGVFTDDGYNISSDGAYGLLASSTDQTNTDPLLGPLADNGGPTFTCALLPGSPAIDKGKSFGLTTDQRGLPRPFDFAAVTNASGGDGSDIGAFELERPTVSIQPMGSNALLSWPSYYSTNYVLQSSTNIASSNGWTTAGGGAAIVGNQYQQTNGPISSDSFFRLKGN